MRDFRSGYLWLAGFAVPIGVLATGACSSDSAPPGNTGGTLNPSTGGSTAITGGTATGTGGASTAGGVSSGTTGGTSTAGMGTTPSTGGTVSGQGGATTTTGGVASAGTTATGGTPAATGGTGGAAVGGGGGTGPKVKLCATSATSKATATFVDFETYDGKADPVAWAFSPFTSSYAGFWAGSPTTVLAMLAGHAGSYGLNVSSPAVEGTSWVGIGTWLGPLVTCIDASGFSGVTLWVRGTTPTGQFGLRLQMEETTLPDAADPAGGGTCTGTSTTCVSPGASGLPVTADWTQVSVPWAMFSGGLNGATPVTATGARVTGFLIEFGFVYVANPNYNATDPASPASIPVAAAIDFSFDDLGFSP